MRNRWRGADELYSFYVLHHYNGQTHVYLISLSVKIITKRVAVRSTISQTGPDRTKFTHCSSEWTGQIRCHVRCSIASHYSGNSGNTFSLTPYSDYITKTLHNTHPTAKNIIQCLYIVTWVRRLTETCGKSVWELYCVEQVLPGVTCHHQAAVSKLWYGLS